MTLLRPKMANANHLKKVLLDALSVAGKTKITGTSYIGHGEVEVTEIELILKESLRTTEEKEDAKWVVNETTGMVRGVNSRLVFAALQIPRSGDETLRIGIAINASCLHRARWFTDNMIRGFAALGKSLQNGEPWYMEK